MLREIKHVRQIEGEPRRRWFTSAGQDLMLWFDADDNLLAWQFCYDKTAGERALSWREGQGMHLQDVDDGESGTAYKATPVLTREQDVAGLEDDEKRRIAQLFNTHSTKLPPPLRHQIVAHMCRYLSLPENFASNPIS